MDIENIHIKNKLVLLMNVGTPDKPEVKSVGRYLFRFLNDKYVVDIPWLWRKLLVNLVIIPFRVRKSTSLYKKLWTPDGAPLIYSQSRLIEKLRKQLPDNYLVAGAMRYGNPSVTNVLKTINFTDVEEIIVVPLFPQYAFSTTETARQHLLCVAKKMKLTARIRFVEQFYANAGFISVFSGQIRACLHETFDHIVFSYHGLPVDHINKLHPDIDYHTCTCAAKLPEHGKYCYRAACYETSRLLASKLSIPEDKYTVSFQSRLGNRWIEPFTDKVLLKLLEEGNKRVLVATPSFVADCLETTVEIDMEYKDIFERKGGEKLMLVKSLNDKDEWVAALIGIISGK